MDDGQLKRQLAMQMMRGRGAAAQQQEPAGFRDFAATELYCPKCKQAMPVREKMLLVLSGGELYDYVCERCGTSLGTRTT